jgi:hypothetical protein
MVVILVLAWILFPAFLLLIKLTVQVRTEGLFVHFRPMHLRFKRIPLDEVVDVQTITYSPLGDFGGWGIRYGDGTKAYIVNGNRGVRLTFSGGDGLLIGSMRPEELEMAIDYGTKMSELSTCCQTDWDNSSRHRFPFWRGMADSKGATAGYTSCPQRGGRSTSPCPLRHQALSTVAEVGTIGSPPTSVQNIIWQSIRYDPAQIFVLIASTGNGLLTMGMSMDMGTYYRQFPARGNSAAAAPVSTVIILESYVKMNGQGSVICKISGIGGLGLVLGTVWLQFASDDGSTVTAMRGLFITASALCVVSMLLALKWVPEPKRKMERREAAEEIPPGKLIHFERGRYAPVKIMHIMKVSARTITHFLAAWTYYVVTFGIHEVPTFCTAFPIFLNGVRSTISGCSWSIWQAA